MGKLLMDERPLVVLPSLAVALGDLDEAVIVQQIHYWLEKKMSFADGRYWVYNSKKEWLKQFPWIKSERTLQRKFDHLKEVGILITGNFNKMKMDRTIWYSLDYEKLESLDKRDEKASNDALGQNDRMHSQALGENVHPLGQNDRMESDKMTESIKTKLPNAIGQNDLSNTIDYTYTTQENTTKTTTTIPDDDEWSKLQDDFAEVNSYCMVSWGLRKFPMVMQNILNKYTKELGTELVKYAIDLTIIQNPTHPNLKYTQAICDNWLSKNIKTLDQAKQADDEFKKNKAQQKAKYGKQVVQKESLPNWAQPGYQEEEVENDPEKSAKIERLMSKIKGDKNEPLSD